MQDKSSASNRLISVVVVNWNAGDLLERCIASALKQTLPPFEVIVIDNDSSDGSAKNIGEKFPSVHVVNAGGNIGFAAANNLALQFVSDESGWVVLLNPDAFPEPTWLEALYEAAQRNPEYAFFGSRLMDANNPMVLDGTGDAYHNSGLVWREGHGSVCDSAASQVNEIFSPCAAAAMYRKDVFLAAGGFDEDFFCYVEDIDLGFRLRLLGHRCGYVPTSVVYHVGSAVTGRRSEFSVYHGHRNLVWTFFKNMPGALFWGLLPLHLILNMVTVIYFAGCGQGKLILRAKWDAIKGIPSMWRKRRVIQSNRVATARDIWQLMNKRIIPAKLGRMGKY
jgi:GT2 family glycosyltransferase